MSIGPSDNFIYVMCNVLAHLQTKCIMCQFGRISVYAKLQQRFLKFNWTWLLITDTPMNNEDKETSLHDYCIYKL